MKAHVHVSNLKISPPSTFEAPWRFQSLVEAIEFGRIIFRPFYAEVVGDPDRYQIWPGGRVHHYREEVVKQILERAARKQKAKVPA